MLATQYIDEFMSLDLPLDSDVARILCDQIVIEIPDVRNESIYAVSKLCFILKTLCLRKSTSDGKNPLRRVLNITSDAEADQMTHRLEQRVDSADDKLLIDDTGYGWFCWPGKIVAYRPAEDGEEWLKVPDELRAIYETLGNTFKGREFWKLYTHYASEEHFAERDRFSMSNVRMYKSIFELYKSEAFEAAQTDLMALAKSTEKSHQRAASELVCGIIRGSKHWTPTELAKLWEFLLPVLAGALQSSTLDSVKYWEKSLMTAMAS